MRQEANLATYLYPSITTSPPSLHDPAMTRSERVFHSCRSGDLLLATSLSHAHRFEIENKLFTTNFS
jgi:hypothetical protein